MFDLRALAYGILIVAVLTFINAALVVHSDGSLPDVNLTPGDVETTDKDVICNTKTSDKRHVTDTTKDLVRHRYGMDSDHDKWCATAHKCEIDHLVSLELGGKNTIGNLWPQPYDADWNARDKDRLENKLHAMICSGDIEVVDAQNAIKTNWIEAYKKYVNPTPIHPKKKAKPGS